MSSSHAIQKSCPLLFCSVPSRPLLFCCVLSFHIYALFLHNPNCTKIRQNFRCISSYVKLFFFVLLEARSSFQRSQEIYYTYLFVCFAKTTVDNLHFFPLISASIFLITYVSHLALWCLHRVVEENRRSESSFCSCYIHRCKLHRSICRANQRLIKDSKHYCLFYLLIICIFKCSMKST